jgi:hypothetical protein
MPCTNHPSTPAEWLDLYCQDCWERYTSLAWWELIANLEPEETTP